MLTVPDIGCARMIKVSRDLFVFGPVAEGDLIYARFCLCGGAFGDEASVPDMYSDLDVMLIQLNSVRCDRKCMSLFLVK